MVKTALWAVFTAGTLLLTAPPTGAQDEPLYRGRPASKWEEMFKKGSRGAAAALAAIGREEYVPLLVEALKKDKTEAGQSGVARALGQMGAVRALADLATHEDAKLRVAVARGWPRPASPPSPP